MAVSGAELATLREAHRMFQAKAGTADDVAREARPMPEMVLEIRNEVDGAVQNAVWSGGYADQFRGAWDEYKTQLQTLSETLGELVTTLDQLQPQLETAAEDVKANHNNIATATGESDRI